MKITVTAEDIAYGKVRSCRECPVALAIRRANPSADIYVDGYRIAIDDGRAVTPDIAREFIGAFDGGYPVEPFEFELKPREDE